MKCAVLRQQPLFKVQVASSSKKNFFFLKKEIQSIYSLRRKQAKGIEGANDISKVKGMYVQKTEVREGRHAFKKCIGIGFAILTLVNL